MKSSYRRPPELKIGGFFSQLTWGRSLNRPRALKVWIFEVFGVIGGGSPDPHPPPCVLIFQDSTAPDEVELVSRTEDIDFSGFQATWQVPYHHWGPWGDVRPMGSRAAVLPMKK